MSFSIEFIALWFLVGIVAGMFIQYMLAQSPVNFKKITEKYWHDYDHNPNPVIWSVVREIDSQHSHIDGERAIVAWVCATNVPLDVLDKPLLVYFKESDIDGSLPRHFESFPKTRYKKAHNCDNYLLEGIS